MSDDKDKELIERVAEAMFHVMEEDLLPSDIHSRFGPQFTAHARVAIAAVRAHDRGQRAKIDAALAPVHDSDCSLHNGPAYPVGPCDCARASDPDDYRDLPTALTDPPRHSGGLTTIKRG